MRITVALVKVARVLLADTGAWYGFDLSRRARVRSGVLYPMLARMLKQGWIEDAWDDASTIPEGQRPRRYYQLTDLGRAELTRILTSASQDKWFTGWGIQPPERNEGTP